MKAFALASQGKPASLIEVPKPEVGPDQVRVAVRAASVDDFAVGDEVFGFIPATPPLKTGAFAEYLAGGRELVLARKPGQLDFHEAAALPLAGSAALDLLEAIDGQEGDVVLIVGATGGVGTLAVQLAARRGLSIIATARPDEDEFLRELGAAEAIDYSAASVADAVRSRHPEGVAALIDAWIGTRPWPRLRQLSVRAVTLPPFSARPISRSWQLAGSSVTT